MQETTSKNGYRTYPKEFKVQAVVTWLNGNKPAEQVAKELGIKDRRDLNRWKKELIEKGKEAFPGNGRTRGIKGEIKKLERELEAIKLERDMFKKLSHRFAKTLTGHQPNMKNRVQYTKFIFPIIHELRNDFDIIKLCKAMSVQRSGYYKWHDKNIKLKK